MTETITRQVHIDFGRDGTYGHASADVSAYVLNASFSYGFTGVLEEVAAPAVLTLTLANPNGDWWQDVSAATLYGLLRPGLWVRVQYVYSATTYVRYYGRIQTPVRYAGGRYGPHIISITAADDMPALDAHDYAPALARNTTVDTQLLAALESGALVDTYYEDVWVLGASLLGTNTRLPKLADRATFETGVETLAFVGAFSGTAAGSTAGQYIRELVASERGGRFFWDAPTGKYTFFNRHHGLTTLTSSRTITGADIQQADISYGGNLVNKVFVNYALLKEGAAGGVVWSYDNLPLRLKAGDVREFKVQYRDATNDALRVAAVDPILPVAGTDYVAYIDEGGTGAVMTTHVSAAATFGANDALLTISNSASVDVYLTTLQLRATPLTALDGQQASDVDAASISTNGYFPLQLNIPWINESEHAESYAHWLTLQFKDAATRFNALTVLAEASEASALTALDADVGDLITVQEDWANHNATYFVMGKSHMDSGTAHYCTLYLRPSATVKGWILAQVGRGELGTNTYLVH